MMHSSTRPLSLSTSSLPTVVPSQPSPNTHHNHYWNQQHSNIGQQQHQQQHHHQQHQAHLHHQAQQLQQQSASFLSVHDFSASLQTLFNQINTLSEEKQALQASYLTARAHRKEVQAQLSLQNNTSPPSSSSLPSSGEKATTTSNAVDIGRTSRGRAATGGMNSSSSSVTSSSLTSSTLIEQHSARLRSASLERAKQRETKAQFPRTMLSGASPIPPSMMSQMIAAATSSSSTTTLPSGGAAPNAAAAAASLPQSTADERRPELMVPASPSPSQFAPHTPPGAGNSSYSGTFSNNSSPSHNTNNNDGSSLGIAPADPSLLQATQELYLQLRDPVSGLAVSDRRVRFRVVPACFHANDVIEWMVTRKWGADRQDAVLIIQALVDQGVIVSVHPSAPQTSGEANHPIFEDTSDDTALYRLKDPLVVMAQNKQHQAQANAAPAPASPSITAAAPSSTNSSPLTAAPSATTTAPSSTPTIPTWQFTPLVTQCSIAMLPSLARAIEKFCADMAAVPPPHAGTESTTASSLDSTPCLQQLRTNILYLCNRQKHIWKKEPNNAAGTAENANNANQAEQEEVETLSMEKSFQIPVSLPSTPAQSSNSSPSQSTSQQSSAVASSTPSSTVAYNSLIQKSTGLLNGATTPTAYLTEFLDLKLRRRWEPLLTSGRMVQSLGEHTRLIHLLTNMSPLGVKGVAQREVMLFQDWFVDTTEQEAAARAGKNGTSTASATEVPPTYIVYELSIQHPSIPAPVPSYKRMEVLLNARIVRSVTTAAGARRTELTVINQLDFCFDTKEAALLKKIYPSTAAPATGTTATSDKSRSSSNSSSLFGGSSRSSSNNTASANLSSRSDCLPAWFLEKWLGLPSSLSLALPATRKGLTVLPHSPNIEYDSGFSESLRNSEEDVFSTATSPTKSTTSSSLSNTNPSPTSSTEVTSSTPPPPALPSSPPNNNGSVINPEIEPPPSAIALQQFGVEAPAAATAAATTTVAPTSEPVAEVSPPPADPNYIPDFQPLAVLGRGAYSKILLVKARDSGKLFAMKVLRKLDVVSVGHEGHVMTEQAILARLSHPFICRLHYAFQSQNKLYMVVTYAAGGDLWTLIRRQKLSEETCAFYAAELVLALRYAHRHGVIHRDVKPENLFIEASGHLVLGDFGLSHERQSSDPDQRSYSVSGTSEYLSPETILMRGHTTSMDWWQVGVILHELLTGGRHPFYHKNLFRMQQNILHRNPVLAETISKDARSLIMGLLVKDPNNRLGRDPEGRDIEKHPFFVRHAQLGDWGPVTPTSCWARLEAKLIKPGYVPSLQTATDVSHFDAAYTSEMSSAATGGNNNGGAGNGGAHKLSGPDSVFNSLVTPGTNNSLSLASAHLNESCDGIFETNFNKSTTTASSSTLTQTALMEEMELEEDSELKALMHPMSSGAQQIQTGPGASMSNPQSSGYASSVHMPQFASGQLHPNAMHGSNSEQPFQLSTASHSMLYNNSPQLGGMKSPPLPPPVFSSHSRPGSASGVSPGLPPFRPASAENVPVSLPPLPQAFGDSSAASSLATNASLPPAALHMLQQQQQQPPSMTLQEMSGTLDHDYFGRTRHSSNSTHSNASSNGATGGAAQSMTISSSTSNSTTRATVYSSSPSLSGQSNLGLSPAVHNAQMTSSGMVPQSSNPNNYLLPHPGLFLRSQSLPSGTLPFEASDNPHPQHSDSDYPSATNNSNAGGNHGSGISMMGGGSNFNMYPTAHSSSASTRSSPALGPHLTSMLPPPRLNYPLSPASGVQKGNMSDISSSNSSPLHTPSGLDGSGSFTSHSGGSNSNEYYASSSSSLPNSFHAPHGRHTHHMATHSHMSPHLGSKGYESSPAYHAMSQSAHLPNHSRTNSKNSSEHSSNGNVGGGDNSMQYVQSQQQQSPFQSSLSVHPPLGYPANNADEYDEIEAQYLEPNDEYLARSGCSFSGSASVSNNNFQTRNSPVYPPLTIPTRPSSSSTPVSPVKFAHSQHQFRIPYSQQQQQPGQPQFNLNGQNPPHRAPSSRMQLKGQQLQQALQE